MAKFSCQLQVRIYWRLLPNRIVGGLAGPREINFYLSLIGPPLPDLAGLPPLPDASVGPLLNKSEHSETTEFDPKRPFSSALHDLIASPPPSGVTESPSDIGVFGKTQSCGEL